MGLERLVYYLSNVGWPIAAECPAILKLNVNGQTELYLADWLHFPGTVWLFEI
jgi:hypothetical protein